MYIDTLTASTHQLIPKLVGFIECSDWDISTTLYELLRDLSKGSGVTLEISHEAGVGTTSQLCDLEKICGKVTPICNVRATMRHSKEDQPSRTGEYARILLR